VVCKCEVDVVCALIDFVGVEIVMSMMIGCECLFEKVIKFVVEDYDFVCIDMLFSFGLLMINVLMVVDKVIVFV